jgi:hypothetical protein
MLSNIQISDRYQKLLDRLSLCTSGGTPSKKMTMYWNIKFEIDNLNDGLKYNCQPHYTHLQVAHANAQPKLAKECNFANASLFQNNITDLIKEFKSEN